MLIYLQELFLLLILMCFKLCSSFGLDDEKFENEHLSSNVSDPGQVVYGALNINLSACFTN